MSPQRMFLKLGAVALGLALAMPARARSQEAVPKKKATSQTRIKVQKEPKFNQDSANAVLERTRQDSIARMEQMRRDSIAAAAAAVERARQDSINRVEQARRDSIARVEQARRDSIARAEQMRRDSIARADSIAKARAMQGSGFYIGAGGGVSIPLGDAKDDWNTGWTVFVPVGYDWADSPFGIRVDGAYDHWSGKTIESTTVGDYKILAVNADLKLRYPLSDGSPRIHIYGLVGGNYDNLKVDGGTYSVGSSTNSAINKFGFNAGGGFEFGWDQIGVIVEGRYMSVSADGGTLKWVPIVAGLTWHFR